MTISINTRAERQQLLRSLDQYAIVELTTMIAKLINNHPKVINDILDIDQKLENIIGKDASGTSADKLEKQLILLRSIGWVTLVGAASMRKQFEDIAKKSKEANQVPVPPAPNCQPTMEELFLLTLRKETEALKDTPFKAPIDLLISCIQEIRASNINGNTLNRSLLDISSIRTFLVKVDLGLLNSEITTLVLEDLRTDKASRTFGDGRDQVDMLMKLDSLTTLVNQTKLALES